MAGIEAGCLVLAVDAPPVDGKANEALRALLAEVAGVPRSRVELVRGATSKIKAFLVAGVTPGEVTARLAGT